MLTNQIAEIDQSNNIRLINPKEENLPTTEEVSISPEEKQKDEIIIGFVGIEKSWDQDEILIDDIFSFIVALNITNDDEDSDPKTVEECLHEIIGQSRKMLFK